MKWDISKRWGWKARHQAATSRIGPFLLGLICAGFAAEKWCIILLQIRFIECTRWGEEQSVQPQMAVCITYGSVIIWQKLLPDNICKFVKCTRSVFIANLKMWFYCHLQHWWQFFILLSYSYVVILHQCRDACWHRFGGLESLFLSQRCHFYPLSFPPLTHQISSFSAPASHIHLVSSITLTCLSCSLP